MFKLISYLSYIKNYIVIKIDFLTKKFNDKLAIVLDNFIGKMLRFLSKIYIFDNRKYIYMLEYNFKIYYFCNDKNAVILGLFEHNDNHTKKFGSINYSRSIVDVIKIDEYILDYDCILIFTSNKRYLAFKSKKELSKFKLKHGK